MAYELPGIQISLPADQDMSNSQFMPVTVSVAANTVGQGQGGAACTLAATGTNQVIGIVQNNPILGEAAEIMVTGESRCKAVGTIPLGSIVGPGTGGAIVAASTKGGFGRAMESAVNGDTFTVLLGTVNVTQ